MISTWNRIFLRLCLVVYLILTGILYGVFTVGGVEINDLFLLLLHYCGLLVPACFLENLHCQFHSFSGLLRRARHHLPVVHVDGRPDPSVVTCADNLAGVWSDVWSLIRPPRTRTPWRWSDTLSPIRFLAALNIRKLLRLFWKSDVDILVLEIENAHAVSLLVEACCSCQVFKICVVLV